MSSTLNVRTVGKSSVVVPKRILAKVGWASGDVVQFHADADQVVVRLFKRKGEAAP